MRYISAYYVASTVLITYTTRQSNEHITFAINPSKWNIALFPSDSLSSKMLEYSMMDVLFSIFRVSTSNNENVSSFKIIFAGMQWANKS